ncbi:hypothetical protein BPT24_042 [Tenacibaculum phage pT24]|uniref:Uncharacterized protein n=1 Tax=Tenacibaculum phage pT24 TaxID=1880590 RepID=A0A1B4XWK1_9CAUD|nr:hypothetical protein HYP10_gp042 [Tenacibaculum phage pT24]BAV39164.1 hypothetical protein BPT24_042 [Tenacibaculum phage pT24]
MTNTQLKNVKETVKELNSLGYTTRFTSEKEFCKDTLTKDVIELIVYTPDSFFENFTIKIPKVKAYTTEYVLERISKKQNVTYRNYTSDFKKVADIINADKSLPNVRACNYGLGVETIFGSRKDNFELMESVGKACEKLGLEVTYGCSDAEWVRHIKISKKQSNIKLIEKL